MKLYDSTTQQLVDTTLNALADLKANDVVILDVRSLTSLADALVIASGTSTRHVKALAGNVVEKVKEAGIRPLGTEGERDAEWILIDLAGVIVHVMLPATRAFYDLERLWGAPAPQVAVAAKS
jgi:ribosome-associated protein